VRRNGVAGLVVLAAGIVARYAISGAAVPAPSATVAPPPVAPAPKVEARMVEPVPSPTPEAPPAATRSVEIARYEGQRTALDERQPRRRRRPDVWTGPIPTPSDWRRPDGPIRIALQAGHWRADEAPSELSGLRENGTRWERVPEWQVNLDIAQRAATMLEEIGYQVDVLPAVVPPSYRAHLFIAIHADGSTSPSATGYRVAAPRFDATGRAAEVAALLEKSYGEATGLRAIGTVTRRMQNYYAFNFRRYRHALHPMTIGVILETGYLTSASDRRVIVEQPELAARGIVAAVLAYPETQLATATDGGR
jgi:N-acetylmuramoyl-L-alanine amidase